MKLNSNVPIFIILSIFVASNALLYRYLNNDYFVDKKATVEVEEGEKVIFKLISDHETILQERNAKILSEAERLRAQRERTTDLAELKAIEDKLRALEEEARRVQERVKSSENERNLAQRQLESDMMQLSELMESNKRVGAQLDSVTNEFENYVSTLEETLVSKSSSETEKSSISNAFDDKRGLNFLNNLVGNIQENRTSLIRQYNSQMQARSSDYNKGLKDVATLLNDSNYNGTFDENGLLDTEQSINSLKSSLNRYRTNTGAFYNNAMERKLREQESLFKSEMEKRLAELRLSEEASSAEKLLTAEREKNKRLEELEKKLKEELAKGAKKEIVPTADTPLYTSWIHIPGLWESSTNALSYSGKKIDSIAWSREQLKDNQTISFYGSFEDTGEVVLILYGDGRFKSWQQGTIVTLTDLNGTSGLLKITTNGIDENSNLIMEKNINLESGITGNYYLYITQGNLNFDINGNSVISNLPIEGELTGRLGFGNKGPNDKVFEISNIKIFQIQ